MRSSLVCVVSLLLLPTNIAAQAPKDSSRIALRGPTVVAFFAVTQAELDADSTNRFGAAIDDFQWYLPGVTRVLRTHSVELVETYRDTLQLEPVDGKSSIFVARDSVRVGYILWRPAGQAQVYWGVMTDMDLICAARVYFGWARDSVTNSCR